MARPALLESLRSQASLDVAAVHATARERLETLRAELAATLEQERTRLDRELAAGVRRIATQGREQAERRARETTAAAGLELEERLLGLAREALPQLCGTPREALFAALVEELPRHEWQSVRLNPADASLGAKYFPEAAVECDPAISGGMEVIGEDGRVTVSNTLETRLASAWPDLLPGLLAQIAAKDAVDAAAA